MYLNVFPLNLALLENWNRKNPLRTEGDFLGLMNRGKLTFGILWGLAGALESGFFPFFSAGIAREEIILPQVIF